MKRVCVIFLLLVVFSVGGRAQPPTFTTTEPTAPTPFSLPTPGLERETSLILPQIPVPALSKLTDIISIEYMGMDIRDFLKLIAKQYTLNIMISPTISGSINVTFKNTTISNAIYSILRMNQLYAIQDGEIIKILTPSEYKRELMVKHLETRVYDATHLNLKTIKEELESALTPGIGKIVINPEQNKIVIIDITENFPKIEKLLNELSTPPRSVVIETAVIQISSGDDDTYSLFLQLQNLFGEGETITLNESTMAKTPETGKLIFGLIKNFDRLSLSAILNILSKTFKTEILSAPKIVSVDNRKAIIHIGDKVPYVKSKVESTETKQITSQVDFLDVGIKLEVEPKISASNTIDMKIKIEVSSYKFVDITATEKAPQITTTEAELEVIAKPEDIIYIGGLMKESKIQENQGLPFLKDIPYLGALFGKQTKSKEKTSIGILLKPIIPKNIE